MKIWRQISGILKKISGDEKQKEGRESFLKKYQTFRELLYQNNAVLELMAELEEKILSGIPVDRSYMENRARDIAGGVKKIIDDLNHMSEDKYLGLYDRLNEIDSEIGKVLMRGKEIPVSSYTDSLDDITLDMADRYGNKNANLGEMRTILKIPTPDGFAISTFAYKKFMDFNGLGEKIQKILSDLPAETADILESKSRLIHEQIVRAEIPQDLEQDILDAYAGLCDKYGQKVMVSLRSSASREDGEFSLAGQYATFLNVSSDLILQRYKEVVASLFAPKALFYYKAKGLNACEMAMSVGVLAMIDARAAGVVYSRDPNKPSSDTVIINAIRGVGRCLVEGVVTPDTYVISRYPTLSILKKIIPEESCTVVCRADGKLERVPESEHLKGKPCLNDEQIGTLVRYATIIENHYNYPQDIEWAIDKADRLYILQARSLVIPAEGITSHVPDHIKGYTILIDKGIIAYRGIGFGKAYIARTEEDVGDFPEGAVLVARHTSAKFVSVMNRASAIITDVGGTTVHMATLAREFRIPTILDTEVATRVVKNGQEITVDAVNGIVYEGLVKELSGFREKKEVVFKQPFTTVEKIRKLVIPLNFVNPEDKNFRPESCKTFHDITRFAHQKAMFEMFQISRELPENVRAVRLLAGIPIAVYIIDLGGGAEHISGELLPGNILSIPFKAFLKGLSSLEWPEPRHIDVKGFVGMMAHTASMAEEELEQMGEKSFSFIAGEYMNFSIRLGYHLSVVEAFTGENINDNYIRFFFKGGGADIDRRLRRVRLISEILKKLDFSVRVIEDVIDAVVTKYKRPHLEEKLEILGKLTAYTKQMDAIMYDDASTGFYREEFIREHFRKG